MRTKKNINASFYMEKAKSVADLFNREKKLNMEDGMISACVKLKRFQQELQNNIDGKGSEQITYKISPFSSHGRYFHGLDVAKYSYPTFVVCFHLFILE